MRMRRTAVPEIIVRSLDARATCRMKNYKCASVTSSFSHLRDVTPRRAKPPSHAASRHETTLSKASYEIKTFRTLHRKIVKLSKFVDTRYSSKQRLLYNFEDTLITYPLVLLK